MPSLSVSTKANGSPPPCPTVSHRSLCRPHVGDILTSWQVLLTVCGLQVGPARLLSFVASLPLGSASLSLSAKLVCAAASIHMAANWFPSGRLEERGWRLDIVSLLAVIGESAMAEHSQVMTASWLGMLPRIIPAPQALLKPSRPTRMPQLNAAVVGVHNGTYLSSLNYFPNIIHPIESLPPFALRVYEIKHNKEKTAPLTDRPAHSAKASGSDPEALSHPSPTLRKRRTGTFAAITHNYDPEKPAPHVPASVWSPLNMLSVGSFLLTIGIIVWAILIQDGVAVIAVVTISLASSVVGYASWWSPKLTTRLAKASVPDGDVVIRTREGAFIVVKCKEDVARELYTGTEECEYKVGTKVYQALVGFGTFLLMVSVVLLANCNWTMQVVIGVAYILLNGLFWAAALAPKNWFWDLDLYDMKDVTSRYFPNAELKTDDLDAPECDPSFTRTLWYAIHVTKSTGWVDKSGAAPKTEEWKTWLRQAEENKNDAKWKAVSAKDEIVGTDNDLNSGDRSPVVAEKIMDPGAQIAPARLIPLNERK